MRTYKDSPGELQKLNFVFTISPYTILHLLDPTRLLSLDLPDEEDPQSLAMQTSTVIRSGQLCLTQKPLVNHEELEFLQHCALLATCDDTTPAASSHNGAPLATDPMQPQLATPQQPALIGQPSPTLQVHQHMHSHVNIVHTHIVRMPPLGRRNRSPPTYGQNNITVWTRLEDDPPGTPHTLGPAPPFNPPWPSTCEPGCAPHLHLPRHAGTKTMVTSLPHRNLGRYTNNPAKALSPY